MPLFVDHAGMNTLVSQELDTEANLMSLKKRSGNPSRSLRVAGDEASYSLFLYHTNVPTSGGISFSFWINLDDIPSNTTARFVYSSPSSGQSLLLTNNMFKVVFTDTSDVYKEWFFALNVSDLIDQWSHIWIGWDMDWNNDPVCYVNNQEKTLLTTSAGSPTGDLKSSTYSSIGQAHYNIQPNYRLEGRIQAFGIWGSFDENDVEVLYANGFLNYSVFPNESSIVDFWLLGDEDILRSFEVGDVPFKTFKSVAGGKTEIRTNTQKESITIANGAPLSPKSSGFVSDISEGKSLAGLSTHRNGPYGFSTWNQLRASHNPLTRYQIKNSELSFVTSPGPLRNVGGSENILVRDRHSKLYNFDEPFVTERHYPIVWNVGRHFKNPRSNKMELQKLSILSSFGNTLTSFSNDETDRLLKFDPKEEDTDYAEIIDLYLNGGMESEYSPLTYWEFMQYREVVFPKQKNQFRFDTRSRPTYESFYNKIRKNRNKFFLTSSTGFSPAVDFGSSSVELVQSTWDLDEEEFFLTREYTGDINSINWQPTTLATHEAPNTRYASYAGRFGEGYLMSTLNQYVEHFRVMQGYIQSSFSGLTDSEIEILKREINRTSHPGPLYMRRICLNSTQSVSNPSGMLIPETASAGNSDVHLYQGGALWEAGRTRQVKVSRGVYLTSPKDPSYDTYSDYALEIQKKGKNYAIVPEFRMSEQFEDLYEAVDLFEQDIFEVTGGISGSEDSSKTQFYETYSNSEFMRNFEIIQSDHEDFTNATILSLRCKAIKKFLPYKGFYPAQRTAQLAEKFYIDTKDNISVLNANQETFNDIEIGKQAAMVPLFAPGILFNTIKSGIAVDFPVLTSSVTTTVSSLQGSVSDHYIRNDNFDIRIPFEGIIVPKNYIKDENLIGMEPDKYGYLSASAVWDGQGSEIYSFMANNFMAEVPSFFLQGGNMSSIVSKKQSDIGILEAGKVYGMRIKMRRSMDSQRAQVHLYGATDSPYFTPQDIIRTGSNASRETFTMYSRPSAFGPPTLGSTTFSNSDVENMIFNEDRFKWSASSLIQDSHNGYNFPFTPPYYHGEAWCDIIITGSGDQLTLASLQQTASYRYTRYDYTHLLSEGHHINSRIGAQAVDNLNNNAMQLSASVIVDGLGRVGKRGRQGGTVTSQIIVDSGVNEDSRWIIQPKLETPMLNFSHINADDGLLTLPVYGSESVPRGMWHQYGRIPETKQGVFLEVGAIPRSWQTNVMGVTEPIRNLAEFLGFNNASTKLGKIAKKKTVSEAVVAVPFMKENGRRKFFRLDKTKVDMFKNGQVQELTNGKASAQIGRSVMLQLEKMRKFVFPPSMDFLNYDEVEPFAMYIFEFEHTFNQQDLADMWQNLPPDIGETMEISEVAITHPLLQKELMGPGGNNGNKTLDMPDKLQWMVFKVKQRAASNYFKKVVKSNSALNTDPDSSNSDTDEFGSSTPLQFNWPYDYFSLVEMVKIDAEVEIGNADFTNYTDNMPQWNAVQSTPAAVMDKLQERDNVLSDFTVVLDDATEPDVELTQDEVEEIVEVTETAQENAEIQNSAGSGLTEGSQLVAEIEMDMVASSMDDSTFIYETATGNGGMPAVGMVGQYASALTDFDSFRDMFLGGSGDYMEVDASEFGFDIEGSMKDFIGMIGQEAFDEFLQTGNMDILSKGSMDVTTTYVADTAMAGSTDGGQTYATQTGYVGADYVAEYSTYTDAGTATYNSTYTVAPMTTSEPINNSSFLTSLFTPYS